MITGLDDQFPVCLAVRTSQGLPGTPDIDQWAPEEWMDYDPHDCYHYNPSGYEAFAEEVIKQALL